MEPSPIIAPVVALVGWSLVMLVWLVASRMPAMKAKGISLKGLVGGRPGALDGVIDERAQWKAHNYMHLMEQPTLFYAVCFALALLGRGDGANLAFAWAYVGLRVAHSLVQATVNVILYRFMLFAAASAMLILLTLSAAAALV